MEVRKRRRDHFTLQRNGQPQQEVLQGGVYRELGETNEEEISVEEVHTSIIRLKSKKAPCVWNNRWDDQGRR